MNKSIYKIAFEFWAGVGSIKELEDWAETELRKDDPHPDACEMFGLSWVEAQMKSMEIANLAGEFQPLSESGIRWAQEILNDQCKRLLDREITPLAFCNTVKNFDAVYLSSQPELEGEGLLTYPEWMGDLWNCCDWCDEKWTLDNSPHLMIEVRKLFNYEHNKT